MSFPQSSHEKDDRPEKVRQRAPEDPPNEGPSKGGLRLSFCSCVSLLPMKQQFCPSTIVAKKHMFPPFECAPLLKCSILMVASVSRTLPLSWFGRPQPLPFGPFLCPCFRNFRVLQREVWSRGVCSVWRFWRFWRFKRFLASGNDSRHWP